MLENTEGNLEQVDAYIEAGQAVGVKHFLCVAVDLEDMPHILTYTSRYDCVTGSVGIHPNTRLDKEPDPETLLHYAKMDKIIALGETGFDTFRTQDENWQHQRFETHIQVAKAVNKPIIVHSRDAKKQTLAMMAYAAQEGVRGIWHCFSEDAEAAKQAISHGFMISFSGIVTFKNAPNLHEAAKTLPLESILLETDAPYLAPVPLRGKPNQPAYVSHTAQAIANLRGDTLQHIAQATTQNFERLFPGVHVDG